MFAVEKEPSKVLVAMKACSVVLNACKAILFSFIDMHAWCVQVQDSVFYRWQSLLTCIRAYMHIATLEKKHANMHRLSLLCICFSAVPGTPVRRVCALTHVLDFLCVYNLNEVSVAYVHVYKYIYIHTCIFSERRSVNKVIASVTICV